MTLRRIWSKWESLHGEINFDDLLMIVSFQIAAPEAFAFIADNIKELRKARTAKDSDKINKELKVLWDKYTKDVKWESTKIREIINKIFYITINDSGEEITIHSLVNSPDYVVQGVAFRSSTDYWIRYNAEELPQQEIHDQEVLKALNTWQHNPQNSIFRGLYFPHAIWEQKEKGLAQKVHEFCHIILDFKDILRIAEEVFSYILEKYNNKSSLDDLPLFFTPNQFMSFQESQNKHIQNQYETFLIDEIRKALSVSIRFAKDIYIKFSRVQDNNQIVDVMGNKSKIYMEMIDNAKILYAGNLDLFIKVIDTEHIYSIYHFMILFNSKDWNGDGTISMLWMIDLLIDSAKRNPQVVLPQIACILIDKLNLNEIFKDKLPQIMHLMTSNIDLSKFDEKEREIIASAQQLAKNWIGEDNLSPG